MYRLVDSGDNTVCMCVCVCVCVCLSLRRFPVQPPRLTGGGAPFDLPAGARRLQPYVLSP